MIKLKKILNEASHSDIENTYETSELVEGSSRFTKQQVSKIYSILKTKRQFKTLFYRGTKSEFDYRESTIRKDRKLKDTPEIVNLISNAIYHEFSFDIPDRKQCLYTINNPKVASNYGENISLIFPGKKSKVIYNPNYYDSYTITGTFGFTNFRISDIFNNIKFKQYKKKTKDVYPNFYKFLNYIYYMDNVNLDEMLNAKIKFKLVISELNALVKELDNTHLSESTINTLFKEQLRFFTNIINYAKGMKVLNEMNKLPSDSIEIIIYGNDEYLQVEQEKFKSSFEWTGKKWKPKI